MSSHLRCSLALVAAALVPACLDPSASEVQTYYLRWTTPPALSAECSSVELSLEFPDPPYQDPRYETKAVPCTASSSTYQWGAYDTPNSVCVFVRSGSGSAERTIGSGCGDFGTGTSLSITVTPE